MPSGASHEEILDQVVTLIQAIDLTPYGFKSTDVHKVDFPFNKKPPFGILCSMATENMSAGLNSARDIGYPIQIMRSFGSTNNQGFSGRSGWRQTISDRFDHVRIGVENELMTKCRFLEIQYDNPFKGSNVDASALRVQTWVRRQNS